MISDTGATAGGAATLDGLRVLDVGDRPSTAWCGRLLADLGADVIGAEPAGGHPLRRDPPAADYFLANRRRTDLPAALRLAAAADVILTSESSPETSVAALRELSGTRADRVHHRVRARRRAGRPARQRPDRLRDERVGQRERAGRHARR